MRFGCLFLVSTCVFAQSPLATITGLAKDPSGAPVPNADIALISESTGVKREQKTNESGAYSFGSLPPGSYHLEATAAGFRDLKTELFEAPAYRTIRQDLSFELATAATGVTVSAAASEVIQTETPPSLPHYPRNRSSSCPRISAVSTTTPVTPVFLHKSCR